MSIVKLGGICEFINGGTWSDKEYVNSGLPVLKVSNCKNSGFQIEEINYLPISSKEKYKKNRLFIGDIIIATVGSHPNLIGSDAGRSCVVNSLVEGFYLNQNAVCLRTTNPEILDQGYLGYICKERMFVHYIQNKGCGAANQMRIAIGSIKEYEFDLPKITLQRKIANILSTYDFLIENNQKKIKLLEEVAQRLYKEWFVDLRFPGYEDVKIVDGVPEGWKKELIGDLIRKVVRSKQVKTAEYLQEGAIPIIDQSRDFIAGYTNDPEAAVDMGCPIIVFGDHTRILKYIQFPFAKGADGTQLIISNNENMPQSLLYYSLVAVDLSNYHYARHFKYLKAENILVPTKKIAEKFDRYVSAILIQIQKLRDISKKSAEARDRLLPKLMSGEIEV